MSNRGEGPAAGADSVDRFPEVLAQINRERRTGALEVIGARGRRELLFISGELRAARSDIESERLGSWLVARRLISEEVKQISLLRQGTHQPSLLGNILVSRGLLDQAQLESELEELALTIIARAAADGDASVTFHAGATSGQPDTLPNTATAQLILHAARAFPDEDAKRAALGGPADLVRLTSSLDELVQEYEFELPEAILLGRLHRGQRLGDLAALTDLPEEVFTAGLYALLAAGIVEVVPAEARPPAPPAASRSPSPPPPTAAKSGGPASAPATAPHPAQPSRPKTSGEGPTRDDVLRLAEALPSLSHYQLLGVSRDASYQEIFDAWDRFSQRFDPHHLARDRVADARSELEAVLQRGREAFETLSSPQRRPRYDRMRRAAEPIHRSKLVRDMLTQRAEASPSPSSGAEQATARLDVARANFARADELVRVGDVFSAIRLLDQACQLDPSPEALVKLARLMLINPQWSNRALEQLRRALELDPGYVDAWLELAEFWRRRKHAERERKALERVLAAAPDHEEARARYRELRGDDELGRLLARLRPPSD